MAGVRKMPMPTTRLNTTIAVSSVERRDWIWPAAAGSAAMQALREQLRQALELADVVVELRRDAQQRDRMRVQPGLDAALPEPVMDAGAVKSRGGRAARGCGERD